MCPIEDMRLWNVATPTNTWARARLRVSVCVYAPASQHQSATS